MLTASKSASTVTAPAATVTESEIVPTAVMPEDGTVHFAEDIYGHDARLDRALVERARKAAAASTAAATLPTSTPAAAAP